MREQVIEDNVTAYAESLGFISRKMTYAGRHGCRDRDFYGFGHTVKVEFKRPNGSPRPHQERERERMKKVGVTIWVIDDIDRGKALLDRHAAAPRRDDLA